MSFRKSFLVAAMIALTLVTASRLHASQIAYVVGGNIYVVDEAGGTPVQLTFLGADYNCVWSPDGLRIAFESSRSGSQGGRDVYVMDADGSNVSNVSQNAAGVSEDASWSPDGTQIVYRTGSDIWIVTVADPSDQVNLTASASALARAQPAWSPDGAWIALGSSAGGTVGARDVWAMPVDGLSPPVNLTEGASFDMWPDWSPDGTQIAFVSDRGVGGEVWDIWVMDIVVDPTTDLITGSESQHPVTTYTGFDNYPSWSPDGSEIVFWTNRADSGIWAVAPDGLTPPRDLGIPGTGAADATPYWQPTPLAIVSPRFQDFAPVPLGSASAPQTFTLTNNGVATLTVSSVVSNDARLSASPTTFTVAPGAFQSIDVTFTPASIGWQPGALTVTHDAGPAETFPMAGIGSVTPPIGNLADTKIVFASNSDGDWDIYVSNPDGTAVNNLTDDFATSAPAPSTEQHPAWSDDGTAIVFQSDQDGDFDIYTMDMNGGNVFNVTQATDPTEGWDREPDWSPDGSEIVFASLRASAAVHEIYRIDVLGSTAVQLTSSGQNQSGPCGRRTDP